MFGYDSEISSLDSLKGQLSRSARGLGKDTQYSRQGAAYLLIYNARCLENGMVRSLLLISCSASRHKSNIAKLI